LEDNTIERVWDANIGRRSDILGDVLPRHIWNMISLFTLSLGDGNEDQLIWFIASNRGFSRGVQKKLETENQKNQTEQPVNRTNFSKKLFD